MLLVCKIVCNIWGGSRWHCSSLRMQAYPYNTMWSKSELQQHCVHGVAGIAQCWEYNA
jgi:hypothetical protein